MPIGTRNYVVDIETMSTEPNAVIMSIGIVQILWDNFAQRFCLSKMQVGHRGIFYLIANAPEQIASGRHVSPETMVWWAQQDPKAQEVVGKSMLCEFTSGIICASLRRVFTAPTGRLNISEPVTSTDAERRKRACVWGRGPNFDNAILNSYITQYADKQRMWSFRNDRCLRTADIKGVSHEFERPNELPHHALHDAYYEANRLCQVANDLKARGLDFLEI